MHSGLDYKIWDIFNFYNEDFWIPMIIPITLFVIGSIVFYIRETNNAKIEEREKKKSFKVLLVIGIVVGVIEACALEQTLIVSVLIPSLLACIVIPSTIIAIICIGLFILESVLAKIEAKPRKKYAFVLFIIGIVIFGIELRAIRSLLLYRRMFAFLFVLFDILAVVCIVLFIIESIKAKREARPRKECITILFIIALMILFINVRVFVY